MSDEERLVAMKQQYEYKYDSDDDDPSSNDNDDIFSGYERLDYEDYNDGEPLVWQNQGDDNNKATSDDDDGDDVYDSEWFICIRV